MNTPDLSAVKSSNIQSVGYAAGSLFVRFNSGTLWRYDEVPNTIFQAMKSAPSVGSYFFKNVKGKFKAEVVREKAESA